MVGLRQAPDSWSSQVPSGSSRGPGGAPVVRDVLCREGAGVAETFWTCWVLLDSAHLPGLPHPLPTSAGGQGGRWLLGHWAELPACRPLACCSEGEEGKQTRNQSLERPPEDFLALGPCANFFPWEKSCAGGGLLPQPLPAATG